MSKVYRCFAEKKSGFDGEALSVLGQLKEQLGIETLTGVRILHRYDVEGIDAAVYEKARVIVFSEPQVDFVYDETAPACESISAVLAVEALPGQYDQRADSAAQCIQLMAGGDRPDVKCATVYLLEGAVSAEDLGRIKEYLINPVECREAALDKPETLAMTYPVPGDVATLEGFIALDE